jgi:type 2A phosphatase activator TIP41
MPRSAPSPAFGGVVTLPRYASLRELPSKQAPPTHLHRPSNLSSSPNQIKNQHFLPPVMTSFVAATSVRDAGKTHTQSNWKIETHKYPICNSGEIEAMTSALGIAPPEMIFGNNSVRMTHVPSGFSVEFNAFDALDVVDKTGSHGMLKVAYSDEWQRMREKVSEEIRDVVKPFDWSYSTAWKGRVEGGELREDPAAEIPYDRLRRPDPILLFDDVVLYEDELADNGIAMLSVKVRVMPERLLLLQRFFLRLDGVVVRIRDTRVFVEFATGEVVREFVSREAKYEDVKKVRPIGGGEGGSANANREQKFAMYPQDDIPSLMRDPNQLVELLPVIETTREKATVTTPPQTA